MRFVRLAACAFPFAIAIGCGSTSSTPSGTGNADAGAIADGGNAPASSCASPADFTLTSRFGDGTYSIRAVVTLPTNASPSQRVVLAYSDGVPTPGDYATGSEFVTASIPRADTTFTVQVDALAAGTYTVKFAVDVNGDGMVDQGDLQGDSAATVITTASQCDDTITATTL